MSSNGPAPVGQISIVAQDLAVKDLIVIKGDLVTITKVEPAISRAHVLVSYETVGTHEEDRVVLHRGADVLAWRPMVHIPSGEYIRQAIGHLGSEEV